MNIARFFVILVSTALLSVPLQAIADTAESICEVWQNGELEQDRSGDCTWSQRQGYIGITLKNGARINLSPQDTMEYKDADGHKVIRSIDKKGLNTFEWQDRKVVVQFGRSAPST
ncbi:MAG: hypothetical protein V7720_16425 [Halioglobus sp.]